MSLQSFHFERVLDEGAFLTIVYVTSINLAIDPTTQTIILLGTLPDDDADGGRSNTILKVERTALDAQVIGDLIGDGLIDETEVLDSNDVVSLFSPGLWTN